MAYKLICSPEARDDLRDIVRFIARDSRQRAEAFGFRLMREADKLQDFPEIGRVVPEYRRPNVREIIVRSYRIIYASIPIARRWRFQGFGTEREGNRKCEDATAPRWR